MSKTEKVHQFLTAYQRLQMENFADMLFEESALQEKHVVWLENCDSTSEYIKTHCANQLLEPLICISDIQQAGKGQHGRSWQSTRGNLHFSMYLPISQHIGHEYNFKHVDGRLSLETAIALLNMQMLQGLKLNATHKIGIKWPNDLCTVPRNHLVNDCDNPMEFHKFSGILIEPVRVVDNNATELATSRVCGIIFGIGINANDVATTHINQKPVTNLQTLLNHTISLPDLAAQTAQACQKALHAYLQSPSSLPVRYFAYDLLYDKALQVNQVDRTIEGLGAGIQEDGALNIMLSLEESITIYDGAITLK